MVPIAVPSGATTTGGLPKPHPRRRVRPQLAPLRRLGDTRPPHSRPEPRDAQRARGRTLDSLRPDAAFARRTGRLGRPSGAVRALRGRRCHPAGRSRLGRRALSPGARRGQDGAGHPRHELWSRRDMGVQSDPRPVGSERARKPRLPRRRGAPGRGDGSRSVRHVVEALLHRRRAARIRSRPRRSTQPCPPTCSPPRARTPSWRRIRSWQSSSSSTTSTPAPPPRAAWWRWRPQIGAPTRPSSQSSWAVSRTTPWCNL